MKLDIELQVAERVAVEAGNILRRYQIGPSRVKKRKHGASVVSADLQADSIIRAGLESAFPHDPVLSENTAGSLNGLPPARVWIVDGLENTGNFGEQGDEYSVSVALAIKGAAVLGVLYNPARRELFAGCQGMGVTLNGSPVKVSKTRELTKARLTVSKMEWSYSLHSLEGSLSIFPTEGMGYRLARVGAGLDDGVFCLRPRMEWNVCAGLALVMAAGGITSFLDGQRIEFNQSPYRQPQGIVASGPGLFAILQEKVRTLRESLWDRCGELGIHGDAAWLASGGVLERSAESRVHL